MFNARLLGNYGNRITVDMSGTR